MKRKLFYPFVSFFYLCIFARHLHFVHNSLLFISRKCIHFDDKNLHSSSRGIVTFKNICILRNFFPISITGSRLNANCSGQTLIPTYFTLRMCVCACVLFDRNRYFIESINTREYFLKLKREKDGRGIIRKRYIFKYIPFF